MYLVFTRMPVGVTVRDLGLYCCFPCLSRAIVSLRSLPLNVDNLKKRREKREKKKKKRCSSEPSQSLWIILGLKVTFIKKRYIVERTKKAAIRQEEQIEKTKSCRENLWNEIQLYGP